MTQLIIWGTGELGSRVAQLWLQNNHGPVAGFTKTDQRHAELAKMGVEPRTGTPAVSQNDCLLLAIPGHTNQAEAVKSLIAQGTPSPKRAVFISITGYHSEAHGLITEDSLPGNDARSASIAAAEQLFRQWTGPNGVILRLGGLYNRQRGPCTALARRGKVTRLAPPNKTMALMHYDDAAAATFAALTHPSPEPVYLGVTPPCPTRQEFYRLACRTLDLPEPEYTSPLSLPPVEYDVTRLRRDLLASPAYPDWRAVLEIDPI